MNRMKCMFAIAAIWGVGVMTSGCENTMNGSVDGDSVGVARDAIFDEVEVSLPFWGDMHLIQVFITGVPNACEAWKEIQDIPQNDCDDLCDDYVDYANEYLGANTYWNLTFSVWPDGDAETDYDQGATWGDDEFTAIIDQSDVSAMYDHAECEDECENNEAVIDDESDEADDGDLTITKYDSKDLVKGNYELDFGNDDLVKGQFKATYCDMNLDNFDFDG